MKIGLFTDGLPDLSFTAALDWVVEQGIEAVEIATGGFPRLPIVTRTCCWPMPGPGRNSRLPSIAAIWSSAP